MPKIHLAGTRDELHKERLLLLREALKGGPEVVDLWVGGFVTLILGMCPEVIDVDVRQPADEQLQLLGVKYRYKFCRNQLVESL